MKKNRTRNGLLIAAAVCAGLVSVASAVSIGVSQNNEMGAGVSVTSSCQPSSGPNIGVAFGDPSWVSGAYAVDTVRLSNLAAACVGKSVKVSVMDSSNNVLANYSGTVSSASLAAPLSVAAPAATVANVAVVIY